MTRSELEHLIRAAGSIANDTEVVVIGSQSILAQFPDAPRFFTISAEADLFPLNHPELADLIDGSIGEGSSFHEMFGYYAQGVDEHTAKLPHAWRERLVSIKNPNTNDIAGLCLEVHDLAVSKYVAGREKDLEFTRELAKHGMTTLDVLLQRIPTVDVPSDVRKLAEDRARRDHALAASPTSTDGSHKSRRK